MRLDLNQCAPPYEGGALPLSYASKNHELPFRQYSQRSAFAVLARCIGAAPGGTAPTHFSRDPEVLASAYLQILTKWGGQARAFRIHDTKLLKNMGLSDSMT